MSVEFRVLGDISVRVDRRPVDVGHARQRCVLTVLLIEANHTVPVDRLIERVWGEHRLPARPANAVQTYIALLRRALAPTRTVAIKRHATGYRLEVDPDAVDLHRFQCLFATPRPADDAKAATLLERLLELWRGEPFATLDTPWLNTVRATLAKKHQAARLELTDIHLRQGRHAALVADLIDQAREHPLDERLAGQLILALYRSGRQADALWHYHQVRRRLADELGTDPSPPLQELHQRILAADPLLHATRRGDVPAVPRQLPAAPRPFVGRDPELARLTTALTGRGGAEAPMGIATICGAGGVGKTWLALHWAHRHVDRFPDGQLHVNLRGFDPSGEPVSPAVVVRGFLDALGVDTASILHDPDAQAALYRSLTADRRMLVVLDNARDVAQVVPLLPGGVACAVLVTSRRRLGGLITTHGADRYDLDVLSAAEAQELLARKLGHDRTDAEPGAVEELVSQCAGLPLALGVVAARATLHPGFPLAVLAEELREAPARLDALSTGDLSTSVRAVLSWSCSALDAESAAVFGLLGLAPGPDISLPAATSLTGLPPAKTRSALAELENGHLLHQHRPGRYRMHDLIRLYATERSGQDCPNDTHPAALRRLADFYLRTAIAAQQLLDPRRPPVRLAEPVPGGQPHELRDKPAAQEWFAAEHPNLLAAQQLSLERGWFDPVWQVAWALDIFHYRGGHFPDALVAWRAALTAATRLGETATQALAHRRLGYGCARLDRHTEALDHLRQALALAERTDDLPAQAHAHYLFARAWGHQGNDEHALRHARRALRLYRQLGIPAREARAHGAAGWCLTRLGDHQLAHIHCQVARTLFHRHHDHDGEAATLDNLGSLAHRTGDHPRALDYYHEALALYRGLGDTYHEASTLEHLGQTHHAAGDRTRTQLAWEQAFRLYHAHHHAAAAERVQRQLAQLDGDGADPTPHNPR